MTNPTICTSCVHCEKLASYHWCNKVRLAASMDYVTGDLSDECPTLCEDTNRNGECPHFQAKP